MRPVAVAACLVALVLVASAGADAQNKGSHHGDHNGASPKTPYAGMQTRTVSSLSPADITDIEAGRGWGLALPAELNGYPGPLHVIELAEPLKLTAEQRRKVEAVFKAMRARASAAGTAFIAAEKRLDETFRSGRATPDVLRTRIEEAALKRAELRRAHLDAHLETAALLTAEQKTRYARLRGYGETKPPARGSHH